MTDPRDEAREIVMSGGAAGPEHCLKHQVPLIHTITEHTYCAICEAAQNVRLVAVVKAARAVTDHICAVCEDGDWCDVLEQAIGDLQAAVAAYDASRAKEGEGR